MDIAIFVVLMALALFGLARGFRVVEGRWGPWPGERPWWGRPWTWVMIWALLVTLGVFVAPRYLGGIVILLPFVWMWRPRWRRWPRSPRRGAPRQNGPRTD